MDNLDPGDQVRSEIAEFYQVSSAFLVTNSIFVAILSKDTFVRSKNANDWWPVFFILLNLIWFAAVIMQDKWIQIWWPERNPASNAIEGGSACQDIRDKRVTVFGFSLRKLFFILPILFTMGFITLNYVWTNNSTVFVILSVASIGLFWITCRSVSVRNN